MAILANTAIALVMTAAPPPALPRRPLTPYRSDPMPTPAVLLGLLAAATLACPAMADERWSVDGGQSYYEAEVDGVALFSFPYANGKGVIYIEGLVGNLDGRGTHAGYWIASGDGPCTAMLTGPDGFSSNNWGWATITFDQPTFPTAWTGAMGECNYDGMSWEMRATPY